MSEDSSLINKVDSYFRQSLFYTPFIVLDFPSLSAEKGASLIKLMEHLQLMMGGSDAGCIPNVFWCFTKMMRHMTQGQISRGVSGILSKIAKGAGEDEKSTSFF